MMEVFANEFLKQNPGVLPHPDVAFVLAFALIMLNTDAHNPVRLTPFSAMASLYAS